MNFTHFEAYFYFRTEDEESEEEGTTKRISWSLEVFHDVQVDPDAPKWRRVFQRGIGMRRNICQGKFELWRLFLTDADSLPVKKMTKDTSFRELRYVSQGSRFDFNSNDADYLAGIRFSVVYPLSHWLCLRRP